MQGPEAPGSVQHSWSRRQWEKRPGATTEEEAASTCGGQAQQQGHLVLSYAGNRHKVLDPVQGGDLETRLARNAGHC